MATLNCPHCGAGNPSYCIECIQCGKQMVERKTPVGGILILIFCIIGILYFMVSCFQAFTEPTEYEKNFNNIQDKTYDEMSPEEKEVYEDYVEWELTE